MGKYIDDILLGAGCVCILVGLGQWNPVVTWVTAGVMLIGWGVLIGKVKGNDSK